MKKGTKVALGGAAATAVAAAVGAYFLTGKRGQKNRRKLKAGAIKVVNEVKKELGKAKAVNKKVYNRIVSEVAKNYRKMKKVDTEDIALAVGELKRNWDAIVKQFQSRSSRVKVRTKKK